VNTPIGVFDSGVGGLSVAREIRARLPAEVILYFADTLNCPYGGRPLEAIRELSLAAGAELVARGAKIIVVACNTASGAALETMRARLPVPIVGLEPAVKPAVATTKVGRVGVMATEATLRTARFQRLTRDHASDITVVARGCPGLVELVEAGVLRGDRVRETLAVLVGPLRDAGVDSVVLGCTHYPFLREEIEAALGPDVRVIDSGPAVARQVERVLAERGALVQGGSGHLDVLTTGDPALVAEVVARLWDEPVRSYVQVASRGAPDPAGSSTNV
jgi:glutamate racemase